MAEHRLAAMPDWMSMMRASDLPSGTKLVLWLLVSRGAGDGAVLLGRNANWVDAVAQQGGLTPGQVKKGLDRARQSGWLTVKKAKGPDGRYTDITYCPTFPEGVRMPGEVGRSEAVYQIPEFTYEAVKEVIKEAEPEPQAELEV